MTIKTDTHKNDQEKGKKKCLDLQKVGKSSGDIHIYIFSFFFFLGGENFCVFINWGKKCFFFFLIDQKQLIGIDIQTNF